MNSQVMDYCALALPFSLFNQESSYQLALQTKKGRDT